MTVILTYTCRVEVGFVPVWACYWLTSRVFGRSVVQFAVVFNQKVNFLIFFRCLVCYCPSKNGILFVVYIREVEIRGWTIYWNLRVGRNPLLLSIPAKRASLISTYKPRCDCELGRAPKDAIPSPYFCFFGFLSCHLASHQLDLNQQIFRGILVCLYVGFRDHSGFTDRNSDYGSSGFWQRSLYTWRPDSVTRKGHTHYCCENHTFPVVILTDRHVFILARSWMFLVWEDAEKSPIYLKDFLIPFSPRTLCLRRKIWLPNSVWQ